MNRENSEYSDVRNYLLEVLKRWKVIAGIICVSCIVSLIICLAGPRKWQTSFLFQIGTTTEAQKSITTLGGTLGGTRMEQITSKTQSLIENPDTLVQLIKSGALLNMDTSSIVYESLKNIELCVERPQNSPDLINITLSGNDPVKIKKAREALSSLLMARHENEFLSRKKQMSEISQNSMVILSNPSRAFIEGTDKVQLVWPKYGVTLGIGAILGLVIGLIWLSFVRIFSSTV